MQEGSWSGVEQRIRVLEASVEAARGEHTASLAGKHMAVAQFLRSWSSLALPIEPVSQGWLTVAAAGVHTALSAEKDARLDQLLSQLESRDHDTAARQRHAEQLQQEQQGQLMAQMMAQWTQSMQQQQQPSPPQQQQQQSVQPPMLQAMQQQAMQQAMQHAVTTPASMVPHTHTRAHTLTHSHTHTRTHAHSHIVSTNSTGRPALQT